MGGVPIEKGWLEVNFFFFFKLFTLYWGIAD